jgi:TPP-dependent pyruvate/acetoin dehydrogenase alpha subunit
VLDERFYRSLYRIRRVEQEVARVYPTDKIMSPIHLSIGQEAISVAVCEALRSDDVVFGTYRSHACYLAKGGSLRGMVAELYGKATGVAKGKAGSMHLIDVPAGVMGASAVVASSISQAVGYALAIRMRGEDRVVACFFGDGAVEEGTFHESLNFAALKRLPVLFVCENNSYAIHSRQRDRQAASDICQLARAHGLHAERFAEQDPYRIYASACQAIEPMRGSDATPVLLECCCYRWQEHVGPGEDYQAGYRTRDEAQAWIDADPLPRVGRRLPETVRQEIERSIDCEIAAAFDAAEHDPFPAAEELYTDLYACRG